MLITAWAATSETSLAQLTLSVDRQTGIASVANNSGGTLGFDAYQVESANALLDNASWATSNLNSSDSDWQAAGNINDNRLQSCTLFLQVLSLWQIVHPRP